MQDVILPKIIIFWNNFLFIYTHAQPPAEIVFSTNAPGTFPQPVESRVEKDPAAVKFDEITFEEVLDRRLKVMDLTAFTLCRENRLQIIVFDMDTAGNLGRVLAGEPIGTLVKL